jgi:enamine deaminase RidA (YjgF/YER057c/UK114 family)
MTIEAILPEGWKRPSGYSHGLLATGGSDLFVAGQFGTDPQTQKCVDGFVPQWDQALSNVAAVVEAAGGSPQDIVTLRIYVLHMADYQQGSRDEFGASWVRRIGKHFPAVTMVEVGALEDPDALLEIEAHARIDR